MAIFITIPRLGWNMEEGIFAGWLKPDGATIRAGEALFTLESEKATEDVECLDAGILRIPPDGPQPGDKLAVGAVIGYLVQPGEAMPASPPRERGSAPVSPPRERGAAPVEAVSPKREPDASPALTHRANAPAISPRAKRAAVARGIDWTRLQGTGRTGRIRERDVLAAATQTAPATPSLRRTIAERMLTSHRSTAPVTLTTTADATNLVNLRNQFKAAALSSNDVVPGYTDFLVKLTAIALHKHPELNSRWEADHLVPSDRIHIGIAVDTEAGLLVPVIRDVPAQRLRPLAKLTHDLAERARQRKLTIAESQGGTFTITNLGAFGIDAFTPIINYPECAILGVGSIKRQAVVAGEQIVARDQISLSLTFDHRLVDGAPAARFLQTLCVLIENPGPWLMD